MSMTWYLNSSGDLSISGGTFVLVEGAQEVEQRIGVTLKHYWYEYWLNLQGGVPWYELIFGSKNPAFAKALLQKIILGVPNVVSIFSFNGVFSQRHLAINATVQVSTLSGSKVINFQG